MRNIITIDQYKDYKRLTKTDQDQSLQFIVASVSDIVKGYCGHSFIDYFQTPKVQVINNMFPRTSIQLNQWPIRQVQQIRIKQEPAQQYVVFQDYIINRHIDAIGHKTGLFPQGLDAVQVTYTAGYQQAPQDVKIAAADLVHHYLRQQYRQRKQLLGASIDNSQTRYQGVRQIWPSHIIRVLDLHRNYAI